MQHVIKMLALCFDLCSKRMFFVICTESDTYGHACFKDASCILSRSHFLIMCSCTCRLVTTITLCYVFCYVSKKRKPGPNVIIYHRDWVIMSLTMVSFARTKQKKLACQAFSNYLEWRRFLVHVSFHQMTWQINIHNDGSATIVFLQCTGKKLTQISV